MPETGSGTRLAERVRKICLGLGEPGDVTERLSHGTPTWFFRDRLSFVQCWHEGHHDHTFAHLWCAAPPGAQEAWVAGDPARLFRPPYVGGRGWVGMRLDGTPEWDLVAAVCEDAFDCVRPAKKG